MVHLKGPLKKSYFEAGLIPASMSDNQVIIHRAGFILKGFTLKGI
jgi:hypothetical protein